jgi:hypothetical protein
MARYFGAARFGDPLYAAAAAPDGGYWPLVTLWRRTFHLSHAHLNQIWAQKPEIRTNYLNAQHPS